MTCPECIEDLDHCHGALVLHGDGTVECVDPECYDLGRDRHALVVRPGEVSVRLRRAHPNGGGGTS
jgi:hypothetical protein